MGIEEKETRLTEDKQGRKAPNRENGSVGFWHEELNAVRLDVFKNWIIISTCSYNYETNCLTQSASFIC